MTLHVTLIGGGFGRRLFADYVYEAVELSRAIAKPVQLMWTRADDMRFGYFHPCAVERIAGGLDRTGNQSHGCKHRLIRICRRPLFRLKRNERIPAFILRMRCPGDRSTILTTSRT